MHYRISTRRSSPKGVRMAHPEWPLEESVLARVLRALRKELVQLRSKPLSAADPWAEKNLSRLRSERIRAIEPMLEEPYFGRLDVLLEGSSAVSTYYIGKHDARADGTRIIDWRAPVGSLFYSGSARAQRYVLPDGTSKLAQLDLKRQIVIKNGALKRLVDVVDWRGGVSATDLEEQFLADTLAERGELRLKDIVRTIQAEQDVLIRRPADGVLVIQGVAGSGKTSVAYHRIAYLLYTGSGRSLQPEQVLVLGPSKLFLSYASEVLPDLGVNDVRQSTIADLALTQIYAERGPLRRRKRRFKRLLSGEAAHQFAVDDPGFRAVASGRFPSDRLRDVLLEGRIRGSTAMRELMRRYAEHMKKEVQDGFPESPDEMPGAAGLLRKDANGEPQGFTSADPGELEAEQAFLQVLEHQHRRKIHQIMKDAVESGGLGEARVAAFRKISEYLFGDGVSFVQGLPARASARLGASIDSDRNRQRLIALVERYIDQVLPPIDTHAAYYKLLSSPVLIEELSNGILGAEEVRALTARRPPGRDTVYADDIAAMLSLHFELYGAWLADPARYQGLAPGAGLPEPGPMLINHLVIDEGQDLSSLEYDVIRDLVGSGSMTILGDISQGVFAHRSIKSWDDAIDVLGRDRVSYVEILHNYRSTSEIVRFCNELLRNESGYSAGVSIPIQRHGRRPQIVVAVSESQMLETVTERVRDLLDEGYSAIAVICRHARQRRRLAAHLSSQAGIRAAELSQSSDSFVGDVSVLTASDAKGLEFEAVVVAYASQRYFGPEDGFARRALFVACSRALHSLDVVAYDVMTPLLVHAQEQADVIALPGPEERSNELSSAAQDESSGVAARQISVTAATMPGRLKSGKGGQMLSDADQRREEVRAYIQEGITEASTWQSVEDLEASTRAVPCTNWKAIVAWVAEVGPFQGRPEGVRYLNRLPNDRIDAVLEYLVDQVAHPEVLQRVKQLHQDRRKQRMRDCSDSWWHGP